MPFTTIHSYHDVIDHLLDHFGGLEGGRNVKMAKRAILAAYRSLPTVYNWSYYYKRGRVASVAAYSTGTIAYDHTGGTYERQATLTSGTWPSWAARGILRINDIDYDVHERISDTVVTLSVNSNPGADVASSTTYTLSRDAYPLPFDFQSADQLGMLIKTGLGLRMFHRASGLPHTVRESQATTQGFTRSWLIPTTTGQCPCISIRHQARRTHLISFIKEDQRHLSLTRTRPGRSLSPSRLARLLVMEPPSTQI